LIGLDDETLDALLERRVLREGLEAALM